MEKVEKILIFYQQTFYITNRSGCCQAASDIDSGIVGDKLSLYARFQGGLRKKFKEELNIRAKDTFQTTSYIMSG